MSDLNDIALGSPLYLLFAQAINSRGEIVGIGATSTGELHAFLATPITDGDETFSTAETDETNESGRVIPLENVRTLVQRRLLFGVPQLGRNAKQCRVYSVNTNCQ